MRGESELAVRLLGLVLTYQAAGLRQIASQASETKADQSGEFSRESAGAGAPRKDRK